MVLDNLHHFVIENATFNTHIHHHPPPLSAEPADILRLARAVGASHKSSASAYPTKCHPETRKEVIADIADWVVGDVGANESSSPRESILWFSGPAGAGKTCVMRDVADRCEAEGLTVASYFFSARGSGLTSERPFVATIVHQLTISHPSLQPVVLDIIRGYPTIFEESVDSQMDKLLVRPLQSSTPLLPPPHRIVIAIDGLDECGEDREREHLLHLLHTLVTALPRLFVAVVASRPEFDLRRIFSKPELRTITKDIQLQTYNGTKDIWVFLCDEFEEIRQSHPLRRLIPAGWPFESLVQLLLEKSSGNFILPSTAAKYIKKSRRNPVDSLNIIVGLLENPANTSKPFAELDALYSHILHPPETDTALIKRILHCFLGIAAVTGDSQCRSSTFFDRLLGFLPGTTTTTLCDLHSILSISESEDGPIEFHHKSLEDYLLDPERSQDLFQSRYDTQVDIAMVCANRLTRWDADPAIDELLPLIYVYQFWEGHLEECIAHKPISATLPDILLNMDLRIAMKHRFVRGISMDWGDSTLPHSIHDALCSTQHCVRVCQLLSRVRECSQRCEAFSDSFDLFDRKAKLEALPEFISETGLYAPLNPASRTVFDGDEPHLQNPSTPDLVENLSSTNLLRKSSAPDLYQSPPTPDILPNPSMPDLTRNPSASHLLQTPPAPNPSVLRRLGRRITRPLKALRRNG